VREGELVLIKVMKLLMNEQQLFQSVVSSLKIWTSRQGGDCWSWLNFQLIYCCAILRVTFRIWCGLLRAWCSHALGLIFYTEVVEVHAYHLMVKETKHHQRPINRQAHCCRDLT